MTVESMPSSGVGRWLSRAAVLQFASLALQPPGPDTVAEMRELVGALPDALRTDAAMIAALPLDEWEPEFFSVLGPAGCPVCESSYERAAQASRGPLLAQVVGYYDAFGYAPGRPREVPDHAAIELGFLSFLAMKIAFATYEARREDAAVAVEAYETFQREHLGAWFPDCAEAIQATGSEPYSAIAVWTRTALGASDSRF